MIEYKEEIEIVVVSLLCVLGGMLGTRLKYYALREKKGLTEFDKERFFAGLFLSGGAGIVTALLGTGLHINRPFLIGASIVAGYSGGIRFFGWIQRLLALFARRKLLKRLQSEAQTFAELIKTTQEGDEDEDDNEPH